MWLDTAQDRFVMVPGGPAGQSVDAFDFTDDGLWMANADGLVHYRREGDGMRGATAGSTPRMAGRRST